ncbi:helix-turn-helix transcriptional regulator [Streptomyces sp. Tu 2975]|uniref:helix-turn-helix domain-containing protein n=1 Tax=Streptomyces sp. Tu 2975 TaxID=2676871 RepID=UPI00135AEEA4|nr:helix-turn-helix domain-containing protein [Streptomyces sp. Tu 2975]QIP85879.1 helix-turn-helix transcriptional regulator [Streptomyces sp. Tu 2975]
MTDDQEHRRRVLDPRQDAAALKALTHPLRIRLLGLLRMEGPATASELAVSTGESSASTSYHLRVLAKYAFITEAEHRDGRERRWKSVHDVTNWSNAAMAGSQEARAFVDVARRAQLDHLERSLARHQEDLDTGRLDAVWLEPSGFTDLVARLTPESLTELWTTFERTVSELAARDEGDPRTEQVVLFTGGLALAPEADARGTEPNAKAGSAEAGTVKKPAGEDGS